MKQKVKWYFTIFERALLVLFLFAATFPIWLIITNSLKSGVDTFKIPPSVFFKPVLTNYQQLFKTTNFESYFKNSITVAVCTTIIVVMFGTFAAYGIRLFKSNKIAKLSNILLVGRAVPYITILIPLYIMLNKIGLTGSLIAVIIAHSTSTLPFNTWLISGFMSDVPGELFESAKIDGCTRMQTLFRIIFPTLKPAIASSAILVLQFSWNELIYSMGFTNMKSYTMTVAVARYTGGMVVNWGTIGAIACLSSIPIITVGFFAQKYLISGMTAGAVKG